MLYTILILCSVLLPSSLGFIVSPGMTKSFVRKTERYALEQERVSNWELDTKPFERTEAGLRFLDIVVGSGDSPSDGDIIAVHYAG